ncbi:protein-tyrosine phosphatase-like protein [Aspergillus karnatakaensis]|uniref:tyrosine-protein phosphatase n=1 Tax=Aspergillus karnatakaensis TaxID=1810916 RepID=UPI003CCC9559
MEPQSPANANESSLNPPPGAEIPVDGTLNFRSFGGYPVPVLSSPSDNNNNITTTTTRDRFLHRSGHLENLTQTGLAQLRELGISTIIDLTNSKETNALFTRAGKDNNTGNGDGNGHKSKDRITVVNLPLAKKEFSVQQLAEKYKRYLEIGEEAIASSYITLLTDGAATVNQIIRLLLSNPKSGYLIHCAMGKDRTGVVFAILLSLAGVSDDIVAEEYSLSEACLRSALPGIAKAIRKVVKPEISEEDAVWRAGVVVRTDKGSMRAMLKMVRERFGSVEGYLVECCGVAEEELRRLRGILVEASDGRRERG